MSLSLQSITSIVKSPHTLPLARSLSLSVVDQTWRWDISVSLSACMNRTVTWAANTIGFGWSCAVRSRRESVVLRTWFSLPLFSFDNPSIGPLGQDRTTPNHMGRTYGDANTLALATTWQSCPPSADFWMLLDGRPQLLRTDEERMHVRRNGRLRIKGQSSKLAGAVSSAYIAPSLSRLDCDSCSSWYVVGLFPAIRQLKLAHRHLDVGQKSAGR